MRERKQGFMTADKKIEKKVLDHLKQTVTPHSLAVAISGGVDSMVLAEALIRLSIPFTALNFNHRWREPKSSQEAQWIKKWTQKRNIKIYQAKAKKSGVTSENTARQERWDFILKQTKKLKIKNIAIAHHADDLVETFFLQLLRGSSSKGISSLSADRKINHLQVHRPLLPFSKKEILSLAKLWKVDWKEDATNQSKDFFRNRVRHDLMPLLKKVAQRPVIQNISQTCKILNEENEYWEQLMPKKYPKKVSVQELRKEHIAYQRRYLHNWLKSQKISDIGFEDVENTRTLITQRDPAKINLSKGKFCRRKEGFLFIE
jgi:tRNA(Ile)-lysidine synthase